MTFYRTIDDGPLSEFAVHDVKVQREDGIAQRTSVPPGEALRRHLRRAQPAAQVLPGTTKWVAQLPRDVRPLQLLEQYPRVANALAASWNDPRDFRDCIYGLLIDTRGDRRGFPGNVQRELLALRSHFENSRF